jgi:L-iditol 2-dehydrogenase
MKAVALLGPTQIEIRDVDVPALSDHDVLIKPVRAGICGSDVSLYVGHRQPPYFPFTIGHEFIGRVAAVGAAVTKVSAGQRVIVEPNYICGECRFCRSGRGNICPNKKSMGVNVLGCFGEYTVAPDEFTWPVPDSVSDADAASIEPLAVSLHALLQSGAKAGETVAVVGCGVVGLLLVHVAAAQGIRTIAHDRFPGKVEMAARLGANVGAGDDVAKLWLQEDVSTVFECAGVTATTELSIGAAPRGSKVMLLGLSTEPASFVPLRLVREGVRIEPSLIYDHPTDFELAIRLVAEGRLRPSSIVTDTFPFANIGQALDLASTGQSGKVHVQFT